MNVKFFIDRPVLSIVLSVSIVILGLIGLNVLPVEQYPDIAPPTIQVTASYPGANAETVMKSVVAPLEESINGVEDMIYMSSSATNSGTATISVYFKQGTNPDMAAVYVQNRVTQATGVLPAAVNLVGVTTAKRQTTMLTIFTLNSPHNTYDTNFLSNYINIVMKPALLRVSGVGQVLTFGSNYSMRLWLKPDKMKQYSLIPSDITTVLGEQNLEVATGSFGDNTDDNTYNYVMRYKGRKETVPEFNDMVIKALPSGEVLRLKDVARIELGKESYAYKSSMDGVNAVGTVLFQMPGSNATQVNKDVQVLFKELSKDLPKDVEITTVMSSNDFLYASINTVIETLIIAIILVILVLYFFLQDFRATMVPTISIFVSLIGTFAFISVMGFSLNLLTLFALVLVIGTVVDDAIVVVEAVQARFDIGYTSAYKASKDAMGGLTQAIITTSIVFMAVFIPVSFIGGTSGIFYQQFGLTMAVAVAISTVNALTLSPTLCALMLKPVPPLRADGKLTFADRMRKAYNSSFNVMLDKYKNGVMFFIKRAWLVWTGLGLAVILLIYFVTTTPTGLVPDEDNGIVFVSATFAPGSTVNSTNNIMNTVEERCIQIPGVQHIMQVSGYNFLSGQSQSAGMLIIRLKDWSERDKTETQKAIIGQVYGRTADLKGASIFCFAPGMIPGYGTGNMLEVQLQDKTGVSSEEFYKTMMPIIGGINALPEVKMAYSTFNVNYPQYLVDVDVVACKQKGISPATVLDVLSGYYGGQYVSNINRFTKVYRVMIQADPKYTLDENSLGKIFVRVNGEMAPVNQFLKIKRVNGAESLNRFNLYSSMTLNVMPADGASSGEALAAFKTFAKNNIPRGYDYDFSGMTREQASTGNTTALIFAFCILFIYLILAALYESFFIPFAVILSVPFGLMGSFFFARIMGVENNIYLQTGLIMLIGLLSKTAILLTEYATERRRAGMTLSQAAYSAATVRLRPILMTALTLVFGMLPMMFSMGVGANGNRSLGTGVVGGMVIGTLALLFVVPTLFVVFQWMDERFNPSHIESKEEIDPAILSQQEKIDKMYAIMQKQKKQVDKMKKSGALDALMNYDPNALKPCDDSDNNSNGRSKDESKDGKSGHSKK